MDLSSINPILLLASLMVAATPILLAAIGALVCVTGCSNCVVSVGAVATAALGWLTW